MRQWKLLKGLPTGTVALAKARARQAKSRKARKEAGERQISVWLDKPADTELKRLKDLGETKGVAINRLLHESATKSA